MRNRVPTFAELERERVDAYIAPLFELFIRENPLYNDLLAKHGRSLERITKREELYLSNDEKAVARYFDLCDAAHREHGFTGPRHQCPALISECLQVDAENLLLKSAGALLGYNPAFLWGDKREKMLDLLLRLGAKDADTRRC